jgi:hypothetical protein
MFINLEKLALQLKNRFGTLLNLAQKNPLKAKYSNNTNIPTWTLIEITRRKAAQTF